MLPQFEVLFTGPGRAKGIGNEKSTLYMSSLDLMSGYIRVICVAAICQLALRARLVPINTASKRPSSSTS